MIRNPFGTNHSRKNKNFVSQRRKDAKKTQRNQEKKIKKMFSAILPPKMILFFNKKAWMNAKSRLK
jgi:hypothetical protein